MYFFSTAKLRQFVVSGLFFLTLGFPIGVFAQNNSDKPVDTSWPTFLGADHNGKSNLKEIRKDWSDGKLKLLWQHETGQGYGIGSEANGKFYHFGRYGEDTRLTCLDCETGKSIWKFNYESNYDDMYGYDSGPRSTPVIDGNLVYIYGVEGQLHCLDANSGDLVWKKDLNKQFGVIKNFFGVGSTPTVFNDLLIVMVGGSPEESKKVAPGRLNKVKPNGSGIVAFDKVTGEVRYQAVDDLASYSSLQVADINGTPTLLAWMRTSLYGLEPSTGEEKFSFYWRSKKLESVNAATPVVIDDDLVLLTECYERGSVLLKIDPESDKPKVVWSDENKRRTASLRSHWNTPIVVGDYAYGCSGEKTSSADLRCLNWKTGEVKWKYDKLSRASITWVDDHFVVMGELGELLLIKANPEKIDIVTQYQPGEGDNRIKFKYPCWAAPVIAEGKLFVRGKNKLACFELAE
ncbi:PQQ-like beta-propeller repeat protein [Mariniblastus sp.]|nr:PQQ-like beta-propeller repeat protein [Mariniblastus sp.]